jgi:cell division protein FtsW
VSDAIPTTATAAGRWWWGVDRVTLAALITLLLSGYVLVLAASPGVAERIGAGSRDMFILRQVVWLGLAFVTLVGVSLLSARQVKWLAILGLAGAFTATAATLVIGVEIKGARRWLSLPGVSLQPSEFLKPTLAIVCAILLAHGKLAATRTLRWGATAAAVVLVALGALLLKAQPDIGMLAVLAAVLFAQFFVSGLNLLLVGFVGFLAVSTLGAAYLLLPHVQSRVHRFLFPEGTDTFQVDTALRAFGNGGLFGVGPGEGRVKTSLPDAHADFIFAVAGEEFGMIACLLLILLFAVIVVRGFLRLLAETDLFVVLAATGLLAGFGLQAFINMGSTLNLIPTKGMTLPFVSYGGSSLLAIAFGMGALLAITRRRPPRAEAM